MNQMVQNHEPKYTTPAPMVWLPTLAHALPPPPHMPYPIDRSPSTKSVTLEQMVQNYDPKDSTPAPMIWLTAPHQWPVSHSRCIQVRI